MPSGFRRVRSRPAEADLRTAGRGPDRIAGARRSAEALRDVFDDELVEAGAARIAAADSRHLPDLAQDLHHFIEPDIADGNTQFADGDAFASLYCFGHVTLLVRSPDGMLILKGGALPGPSLGHAVGQGYNHRFSPQTV